MRSACGGFYQKKNPYPNVEDTDRYLGFDWGVLDFNNHKYAIAMKRIENGIKETEQGYDNQDPWFLARQYVYLGMCKQRMGNVDGAIKDFNKALKIDSVITHGCTQAAYTRLGQCFAFLQDHKTAIDYFDKILDPSVGRLNQATEPVFSALNADRAYYLRAVSRFALGNRAGAREDCLNALKLRNQQYPKAAKLLQQLDGNYASAGSSGVPGTRVQNFEPNHQYSEEFVPQMPMGGTADFNQRPTNKPNDNNQAQSPFRTTFPTTPEKLQQLENIATARFQEEKAHEVALREVAKMFQYSGEKIEKGDIDNALSKIEDHTNKMAKNALKRADEVMMGLRSVWSRVKDDFKDMLHFQKLMENLLVDTTEQVSRSTKTYNGVFG